MKRKIALLGATGSIGLQSVDVIVNHSDEFELTALSVGHQIDKLREILAKIACPHVCVIEENVAQMLALEYPHIHFYSGQEGLHTIATLPEVDIVLNAISGFAGLKPTVAAIQAHKDIALANKETLVVAGALVTRLVKENQVKLLPVDSEHSAIFQCLNGEYHHEIERLIITASGGAFRDRQRNELENVTKEDALKPPNWSMGANITIDSATMFNKGLEVIEAKWLFDLDFDQIDVVMHPESIIHSMVEFKDTAVLAQLGTPDMRLPIQYALTYPHRETLYHAKRLDFDTMSSLTFRKMDFERFPALKIAYAVGREQKTYPAVLNGAKEQATALFLKDKIAFLEIEYSVIAALKAHQPIDNPSLDDLIAADSWARAFVLERIGENARADIY